ncbi:FkbM family methyltransferase [Gammaproteobacteria bacterium]|nr:FkbM family methyltransferase [Gammaproteobacteria bacterium]
MSHPKQRLEFEQLDTEEADRLLNVHFKKIIPASGVVLDVGASRGEFAIKISSAVPEARVFSFEPLPVAYGDLVESVKSLTNVSPCNLAVGSITGELEFFETEGDMGSSLKKPLEGQPSKWLTLKDTFSVKCTRLDDFIDENKIDSAGGVALLKSDAQGADLEVILSAGKYLHPKTISSLLIEINFTSFYHDQDAYFDIFSALDSRGYRLAWLYPHRNHEEWLWWADCLFIPKT